MLKEGYESVIVARYFSCVHLMILIPVRALGRTRLIQGCHVLKVDGFAYEF